MSSMKTKDRIIFAALELFNELGERTVTTNHIAAHIQISPGNLYYHFRNKQEIVRAIFELYSSELLERFAPPHGHKESLSLLKHYLDSIFTLMWKYRFFYANLPEILQRDEDLHKSYIAVQEKLRHNLVSIVNRFIEIELIEIADSEMESFVTTLHMITASWLSYRAAMSQKAQVTEEVIHQGMLHVIAVVKPRATVGGAEQLQILEEGVRAMHTE
ncbi:Biofilm operon icaADBC HTH-type negative transcriptional regulator IcaR [Vibrio ruber DSM 16370]|uniref:Biofilm operon icaADBC HTH-type negative transcriptional regulator IcaR n=2 Tax=Vibrio ruber TaxID=184755 RepID=A0A1R4LPM4_VIBR1|nr:Biofilm operon icaADBC HTH-type negative transcriptional regulator IcaR [Vibrio ruber DSM 16370]